MTAGPPAHHDGYLHETALYDSDEELVALVEHFVQEGLEAGEPTLLTFDQPTLELLHDAIDDLDGVLLPPSPGRKANPAGALTQLRRRFTELVRSGATGIRVIGDVPHRGTGAPWEAWLRYEAAVNGALAEFPLWGVCTYDRRITPPDVVEDVLATHPFVMEPEGGRRRNGRFVEPSAFLRARPPGPLLGDGDDGPPDVDRRGVTPAEARAVVVAAGQALPDDALARLRLVVSETVANARVHGAGEVRLRLWTGIDRTVVVVSDEGGGPADPCVGLLPATDDPLADGGRGLWMAHQLCTDISLAYGDGFSVRMALDART